MSKWNCKICKTWGLGGPDGWNKHFKFEHNQPERLGAHTSFGFVPNMHIYARRHKRYSQPVMNDIISSCQSHTQISNGTTSTEPLGMRPTYLALENSTYVF